MSRWAARDHRVRGRARRWVSPRRLCWAFAALGIWACAKAQDEIGAEEDAPTSASNNGSNSSSSLTNSASSSSNNSSGSGSGGQSSSSSNTSGGGGQAGESPTAGNSSSSGGIPQDVLDNAEVVVEYKVNGAGASESSNQIFAHFYLRNQSSDALPLETAELRYWFDPDGLSYSTTSYYSGPDVTREIVLAAGNDGEFDYMGITFPASASLPANNDLNQSEMQMTLMSSGGNFDQSNDYSFDASFVTQAPHDKVTFYLSGKLIWGCEPSGVCAGDDLGQAGAGSDN